MLLVSGVAAFAGIGLTGLLVDRRLRVSVITSLAVFALLARFGAGSFPPAMLAALLLALATALRAKARGFPPGPRVVS